MASKGERKDCGDGKKLTATAKKRIGVFAFFLLNVR
jgi:hypothetical protein